jgi:hypothetical protein
VDEPGSLIKLGTGLGDGLSEAGSGFGRQAGNEEEEQVKRGVSKFNVGSSNVFRHLTDARTPVQCFGGTRLQLFQPLIEPDYNADEC